MGQIFEQEAEMRNSILRHRDWEKGTYVALTLGVVLVALHAFPSQTPGVFNVSTLKIKNLRHGEIEISCLMEFS